MKEGKEVPRLKLEQESLLIETFMLAQLSVGNSKLFCFDVPKPNAIFFFLMGRPESTMAF